MRQMIIFVSALAAALVFSGCRHGHHHHHPDRGARYEHRRPTPPPHTVHGKAPHRPSAPPSKKPR